MHKVEHTLIVMMGCSGTGKSTLAAKIQEMKPDCVVISRDQIRFSLLKEGEDYFAHEKEVATTFYQRITKALQNHRYVIADATHTTPKSRHKLFSHIKLPKNSEIVGIWMEVPMAMAIQRNNKRYGLSKVSEEVIKKQYKYKISPTPQEPFDNIIYTSEYMDLAVGRKSSTVSTIMQKIEEL